MAAAGWLAPDGMVAWGEVEAVAGLVVVVLVEASPEAEVDLVVAEVAVRGKRFDEHL